MLDNKVCVRACVSVYAAVHVFHHQSTHWPLDTSQWQLLHCVCVCVCACVCVCVVCGVCVSVCLCVSMSDGNASRSKPVLETLCA